MSSVRPTWAVEFSPTTGPFAVPTWVAETARARALSTFRGRQQELDVVQPGTATVELDNSARRFDPNNAAGPYFGNLLPGRRVRIRATYGAEGLVLPGGASDYASTPDSGWVPGQELDLRARLKLTDWTPAAAGVIFAQTDATFAQASVFWGVTSAGEFSLTWFTAAGAVGSATSSAHGFVDGSVHYVRATLDVNAGGGLFAVKFYETFDDGASWVQIGSTVTGPATAVPRNSTQAYTIGSSLAGFPIAGTVYNVELGVVSIGTVNASIRFTDGQSFIGGASSGTDSAGNVWTLNGAAALTARVRSVFGGFAEGWPVPSRELGRAPVSLVDGFGLLAGAEIPDGSPLEATIRALGPVNYWKLDEPTGSERITDSGSSPAEGIAIGGGADALGTTDSGLDPASDATALVLDGYQTDGRFELGSGIAGANWSTLVMLMKADAAGAKEGVILETRSGTPGDPNRVVWISTAGYLVAHEASSPLASDGDRTADPVDDGISRLVVIRRTGAGTYTFEIDGAAVSSSSFGGMLRRNYPVNSVLGWTANPLDDSVSGEAGYKGTIQHVALFDRVLTSDESLALSDSSAGWVGDTIDARLGRLLDLAGWSSSERNLDASEAGTLGLGAVGTDALSDARTLERSEAGAFYQQADYTMRFLSRYATATDERSTRARYTFTDQAGSDRFRFEEIELPGQGDWIRNRVTVSYLGGGSVTVEDEASIDAYGAREHSIETILTTAAQARSLAQFVLSRYAEPRVRISSLRLNMAAEPILWEPVLDLELGDRIRVVWTPGDVGSPIEVEALVDGIEIRAGRGIEEAGATLWLVAADDVDFWIWGSALWGSSTVWG